MPIRASNFRALVVLVMAGVGVARAAEPLRVAVSILPQAYFVERVGGPHVAVTVLVGPGQSPHAFEPSPRQVTALADAQVYFRVGIDFETALVPKLERMFPKLRIVDTRVGVPLRKYEDAEVHQHHEPGHPHDQNCTHAAGAPDPHIWLNPLYVKTQARTIADTLAALDPARAEDFRRGLAAFETDLDALHDRLTRTLAPLRGREVFVFHPAFGYFTDAYGLRQVPVEIAGKEPTARQLADLIDRARQARAKVIFVQPQFPQKSAAAVADAIGGAVVPIDDLARDYLKNLEAVAAAIAAGLEPEKEPQPPTDAEQK